MQQFLLPGAEVGLRTEARAKHWAAGVGVQDKGPLALRAPVHTGNGWNELLP